MNKARTNRLVLSTLIFAATVAVATGLASAAPPPAQGVRATTIGNPVWKPVDFHLFSAPLGTSETGYAEFVETALALLPPPNHVLDPVFTVGPGAPHEPPYDAELADGVANLGFHEGVRFDMLEFSAGAGIWLVWMNVPAPGTAGSSPDFNPGPIIQNELFPIHVYATNSHNSKPFSFVGEFDVPALGPPLNVQGHSHFPVFLADNADFGPAGAKLRGSYVLRADMMDASGNGWHIEAHFAIAP